MMLNETLLTKFGLDKIWYYINAQFFESLISVGEIKLEILMLQENDDDDDNGRKITNNYKDIIGKINKFDYITG